MKKLLLISILPVFIFQTLYGQVSLNNSSPTYVENFNTLPTSSGTWANNTTLVGWYAKTDNTASITTVGVNSGSSTTAGFYSFGSTGNTDRAMGFASSNAYTGTSGTGKNYIGLRLSNSGTSDITSLSVTYTGEQWRKENNANAQKLILTYQIGTGLSDPKAGTWIATTSEFTSPIIGATAAAALDGNLPVNTVTGITINIPVTIPVGQEIMLRWEDLNDSGNDHQLAIDDVTVTANFLASKPTQLGITSISPTTPFADSLFSITVESQSESGTAVNLVYDTYIALSVSNGTGTLSGITDTILTAGTKTVTFSGLKYSKAETGVIFTATADLGDTLTTALSSALTFVAVTNPTKLKITSINPVNPTVNSTFSATIQSVDDNNAVQKVTQNTDFALSSTGTGFSLLATGTLPGGSSSVTVSGLTFSDVQDGIKLIATRTSGDELKADTSSAFNVTGPVKLAFKSITPTSPAANSVFTVVVESQNTSDAASVVTSNTLVTLALQSGSGILSGTLTDTIKAGASSVSFLDLEYNQGGSITLSATQISGSPVLSSALSSSISVQPGAETLPLTENFEFTEGINLTAGGNNWAVHSGSGTNPIKVVSPGLSYQSSPNNAVGNAIQITGTGEDVNKTFAPVSSGSIYAGFMLNVSTVSGLDYFFHLAPSTVSTTFGARVYIKAQGDGFTLGISKSTASAGWSAIDYPFNTTHYLVVKYTFNSSTSTDDVAELFINPDLGTGEPLPTVWTSTSEADFSGTSFGAVCIRQGGSSPTLILDAISISTVWEESTLPVELSSFTVSASGKNALLKWETTTETNNAGFEILKSEDVTLSANEVSVSKGRSQKSGWKTIGFVNGKGTTTEKQTYSFSDPSPVTGNLSPVFYQLKQVDTDGKTSLSQILSFIATPVSFEVAGNYPNPFNPSTVIKFNLPEVSTVVVKVHNIIGQEIATLVNGKMDAGVKEVRFDAKGLSSGIYFYSVSANGKTFTKSMTLMK
ncbi:MAG: T9SS type A sorting domain-containing protein [Bacteroidetes bacterium]|nr:T9SS type A sorting domain-containing protein [Bacteroidota bacterium]